MKNLYRVILLATFIGLCYTFNKSCINNKATDIDYYNNNIKESFELYVSYKNDGRMYGLYMCKTLGDVDKIKKRNIKPGEPYEVPTYPDIEFSVYATLPLFDKAHIGDKLQKLPNTNKCYLYRSDSIYRYNCYIIPEKDRKSLNVISEWTPQELGFWKKSASN